MFRFNRKLCFCNVVPSPLIPLPEGESLNRLLFFLVFVLLSTACGDYTTSEAHPLNIKASSREDGLTPAREGENKFNVDDDYPSSLENLISSCNTSGARFSNLDCMCEQHDDNPAVFSAQHNECVHDDFYYFNEACAAKTGAELKACLKLGLWQTSSSRIIVRVSDDRIGEMEAWLKNYKRTNFPRLPLNPDTHAQSIIVVTIGDFPSLEGERVRKAFDNKAFYPSSGLLVGRSGYVELHAYEVDNLQNVLGFSEVRNQNYEVTSSDAIVRDLSKAAKIVEDLKSIDETNIKNLITQGSCATYCATERVVLEPAQSVAARKAVFVNQYIDGVRQNSEIVLYDRSQKTIEAKLVLNYADQPSIMYIPSVVSEGGKIITRVKIFDGKFREQPAVDFVQTAEAANLNNIVARASSHLSPQDFAIISFEAGYSIHSNESHGWLLKGPYASEFPQVGKSVLGWYRATTPAALEFSRGLLSNTQDSPFTDNVTEDHQFKVNGILAGVMDENVYDVYRKSFVIPLGVHFLAKSTVDAVNNAVAYFPKQVRVAALSSKIFTDVATCKQHMKAYENAGIFMVAAAGNEKEDIGTTNLCPQRVGASANLLVVGAAHNGIMEDYSNYGTNWVDIAAPGNSNMDTLRGTSFAGPKVAHAAARLAADFPSATNAQIRMALLISVELPRAMALPVRSGGSVGAYKSAQVALSNLLYAFDDETRKMSIQVPFSVALAVAKKVHNESIIEPLSYEVERRLSVLIKNAVICRDFEQLSFENSCRNNDAKCIKVRNQARSSAACEFQRNA